MANLPFKKVDSLNRKETGPDFNQLKPESLEEKPEITLETESIKVEKGAPIQDESMALPEKEAITPIARTAEPVVKSPAQQEIEAILAEDLDSVYSSLPRPIQEEFKVKGEETANKIVLMLQKTKVKVQVIINLIRQWLKIIPGINRFFLEQEAKIKADKIIDLKRPREK